LATALFCIVVSPVFAKIPDINWNLITLTLKGGATQTKPAFAGYELGGVAVSQGKNTSQNLLEIAQNLQASGHYRRACNTLLQALERPQLNCKTLIRDLLFYPLPKQKKFRFGAVGDGICDPPNGTHSRSQNILW